MDFIVLRVCTGSMMFSAFCDVAGAEVLLGPDNYLDLAAGPFGLELHYRCHCGRAGVIYPKLESRGSGCGAHSGLGALT